MIAMVFTVGALADASSESAKQDPCIYSYKVISAEEIQNNAAIGPIAYEYVDVTGDLELKDDKYESIIIKNSTFDGNISFLSTNIMNKAIFNNVSFRKNADFTATNFDGETDFSGCCFHGTANFSNSRFGEGTTFDYSTFDKDVDFTCTTYDKFVSFYDVTFGGNTTFFMSQFDGTYANLENTTFLGKLDFVRSKFNAPLSLIWAKLWKTADFHESKFIGGVNGPNISFLGDAKFSKCHFSEESIFRNNSFNGSTDFTNSRFDGPSFFNNSSFHGNAIFDGVQFFGTSDFTNARFSKNLALNNTKISTMLLDGTIFGPASRLFLAKSDINRLMVKWSEIKDILSYDTSAYLPLVKNYRDMGTSDADDCYYQFRSLTQDSRSWGAAKVLDILANITCGYGVRADRPVICSLFLVLVCSIILWRGRGLRSPASIEKKTSLYDALYYCLAIFFTIPLPDLKPAGKYRYVPVTLRAIAWTLFALLIATLGKVMIK
jgi:uncharacterized protein YjbI with pentapeptide repeats